MLIIRDLKDFEAAWDSCVLTLGVFDGMHRGHQAILKRLEKRSRKKNIPRVLLSYDPHPDFVLGKRAAERGSELFHYEEKLALFQKFDLDAVCLLEFSQTIARMTAMRYLKEILIGKLRSRHIIIGYDQHFGKGRKGDYHFLKKMQKRYSYKVERIHAVRFRRNILSSSLIRQCIQEGDMIRANQYLGYDFFIQAMVKRGFQRGRKLGFPTINLDLLPTKAIPKEGVYAGYCEWGGRRYTSMINIGTNPTFGQQELSVEAHLLGFQGELYGEKLRLFFKERIRDQIKFTSPQALLLQLEQDRNIIAALPFAKGK